VRRGERREEWTEVGSFHLIGSLHGKKKKRGRKKGRGGGKWRPKCEFLSKRRWTEGGGEGGRNKMEIFPFDMVEGKKEKKKDPSCVGGLPR